METVVPRFEIADALRLGSKLNGEEEARRIREDFERHSKPAIYVTMSEDGCMYFTAAIAEDGTQFGGGPCESREQAIRTMDNRSHPCHDEYRLHYPDGYRMEWVENPLTDARWLRAFARDRERLAGMMDRHGSWMKENRPDRYELLTEDAG